MMMASFELARGKANGTSMAQGKASDELSKNVKANKESLRRGESDAHKIDLSFDMEVL